MEKLIFPKKETILQKLEIFKMTFMSTLQECLILNAEQAKGYREPKHGQKTGKVLYILDILKEGSGAIPVIGQAAALIFKFPMLFIQEIDEKKQLGKAQNLEEKREAIKKGMIEGLLEETASELARIYEYQIAMLRDEHEVKKMAEYAVEQVISYFSHNKNTTNTNQPPVQADLKNFDRNNILYAVISGVKRYSINNQDKHKIDKQGTQLTSPTLKTIFYDEKQKLKALKHDKKDMNYKALKFVSEWSVPSLFTEPGLKVENKDSKYDFDFIELAGSRSEKYGYRAQMMKYVEEQDNTFYQAHHEIDNQQKTRKAQALNALSDYEKDLLLQHQRYGTRTASIVVTLQEINKYRDYLIQKPIKDIKSFHSFLSEKYKRPETRTFDALYYRGPIIADLNLKQSDFSKINFDGMTFHSCTFTESSFKKCHFLRAQFVDVQFEKTNFVKTDMRFSQLKQGTTLYDIDVPDANFQYVLAEITDPPTIKFIYSAVGCHGLKTDHSNLSDLPLSHYSAIHGQIALEKTLTLKRSYISRTVPGYYNRSYDASIKRAFKDSDWIVIKGFPGTGKTQLATHYINNNKLNAHCWKFTAESPKALLNDLKQLALVLDIPEDNIKNKTVAKADVQYILERVQAKLANYTNDFIFFFDNAKDFDTIRDFCPTVLSHFKVVITSRNAKFDAPDEAALITLTGFTSVEAKNYLLSDFNGESSLIENEAEAQVLAERFDYLPLGLTPAKYYICSNHLSVAAYLSLLQDEAKKLKVIQNEEKWLIKLDPEQKNNAKNIFNALQLSITNLSATTVNLLRYLPFLVLDNIPVFLLQSTLESNLAEIEINEFIHEAETQSLISLQGKFEQQKDNRCITLHAITQEVIYQLMSLDDKKNAIKNLLTGMLNYFVKDTRTKEVYQRNLILLPHVEKLLKYTANMDLDEDTCLLKAALLTILGYFYTQIGRGKESEQPLREAKAIYETAIHIPDNPSLNALRGDNHRQALWEDMDNVFARNSLQAEANKVFALLKEKDSTLKLAEAYVSTLYSLGRTYFYTKEAAKKMEYLLATHLAYQLSKTIGETTQKPLIYEYLTECNGLLYYRFEPKANKQLWQRDIEFAKQRYMALLNTETTYYEAGEVKKTKNTSREYDFLVCCGQLMRACEIYSKCIQEEDKAENYASLSLILQNKIKEFYQSTSEYITKFITALQGPGQASPQQFVRLANYYSILGNFYLQPTNPNRDIQKAIKNFSQAYETEKTNAKSDKKLPEDYVIGDVCFGLAKAHVELGGLSNIVKANTYINKSVAVRRHLYLSTDKRLIEAEKLQNQIHSTTMNFSSEQAISIQVVHHIFNLLDHKALAKTACVNKPWQLVASHYQQLSKDQRNQDEKTSITNQNNVIAPRPK